MCKSSTCRRILRFLSDKRAVSDVLSATMLAGTVVTLSLVVFAWSQNMSSNYNNQLSQTTTTEVDRLKEKIVFEYVYYNSSSTPTKKVSVYLLNCGAIDNVTILNVYVSNSSWVQSFSSPSLKLLNHTPVSDLDRGQEGYIVLSLSTNLKEYAYYSVRIVSKRGATFDSNFVA